MNNIFFDFSSTYEHLKVNTILSGIQRVVVTAVAETLRKRAGENVYLLMIERNNIVCLDVGGIDPEIFLNTDALRQILYNKSRKKSILLSKYERKPIKYAYHYYKLLLTAKTSPRRFHKKTGIKPSDFLNHERNQEVLRKVNFINVVGGGDAVICLDSSWKPYHLDGLAKIKSDHEVKIITMIHDLIPLTMGFTTAYGMQKSFIDWLAISQEYTDVYVANSDNTKKDFLRVFENKEKVKTVRLPHSFPTTLKGNSLSDQLKFTYPHYFEEFPSLADMIDVDSILRHKLSEKYVLCVGTMEPRKNNLRLARAWQYLSSKYIELPKLIFAGKKGWGDDGFQDFLKATNNVNGFVEIIDSPGDKELSALYRNCLFFSYPSLYEGWGLPVGEGISYGKTGVVADNSSLPEVGLDLVEYCDAESIFSIAAAHEKLIFDEALRLRKEEMIRNRKLRDWSDFTNELLSIVE